MIKKKGVTKVADFYGVGCVLFELLTGEPPFIDDDIEKLTKKIERGVIIFPNYVKEDARRVIKVNFSFNIILKSLGLVIMG